MSPEHGAGRVPAPEVVPDLLAETCQDKLPAWGVTRQFEFGQFVILYQRQGAGRSTPLVLSAEGDVVLPPQGGASGELADTITENTNLHAYYGGVPLHLVFAEGDADGLVTSSAPEPVAVDDVSRLLAGEPVESDESRYWAQPDDEGRRRLMAGETVVMLARSGARDADSPGRHALVAFRPAVSDQRLDEGQVNALLAEHALEVNGSQEQVQLTRGQTARLLRGQPCVVALTRQGNTSLVRVRTGARPAVPAARQTTVADLAGFITHPRVIGEDGSPIAVELTADAVAELRSSGETVIRVAERTVTLTRAPYDPPKGGFLGFDALEALESYGITREDVARFEDAGINGGFTALDGNGGAGGGATGTPQTGDAPGAVAQPSRPVGLPIAIFLPWQQRWNLRGFSRGNLLSTIALAPQEETTITISSWERSAKALEQSTETEIERQSDVTQTTRDTEDVMKELTSRQEFQWQMSGSVDASYKTLVASIDVGADGGASSTNGLERTARESTNRVRETVRRATTSVASRRITKITQSTERESSERVVRRLRNPNACHSLTLNFHEVLAHYRISTTFQAGRVQLVVLVPNPVQHCEFTPLVIRKNETALHLGLLEPALAEGFEACRLLSSYGFAKDELDRLMIQRKRIEEADRERLMERRRSEEQAADDDDDDDDDVKPPLPEDPVLEAIDDVAQAARRLVTGTLALAVPFFHADKAVPGPFRDAIRLWLWLRLCEVKLPPSLASELRALATPLPEGEELGIADARRVVDALPGPETVPGLKDLNGLSDQEKWDQALWPALEPSAVNAPASRHWFELVRMSDGFRADDAGVVGRVERLRRAWMAYEAKLAEGEGTRLLQEVVAEAEGRQDQANVVDRLEMAFGIDAVASAFERQEALQGHLEEHRDYYNYVLFQAMPPSEQIDLLLAAAPQLSVGMFEPRVVAMNGASLALPLTPLAASKLERLVTDLQARLKAAAKEADVAAAGMEDQDVILPTPGMRMETSLGRCSGCGAHEEAMRDAERRLASARAALAEGEVVRRKTRLENKLLDDDPLHVVLERRPEGS